MTGIVDGTIYRGLSELLVGTGGALPRCANGLSESASPPSHVTHLVLSYRSAFDELWRLSAAFLGWLESGEKTVVVVWDGVPGSAPEGVPLDGHVTPFDWAAAVSLRANPAAASWKIVILDLATPGLATCRAVPSFDLFRDGLTTLLPQVSVVRRQMVGRCLRQILAPTARNERLERDLVVRLWTDAISRDSQREDRHALSNIIGPMLLLPAMSADGRMPTFCAENPQARAFLALLRALGIAPGETPHSSGPPEAEHEAGSTEAAPNADQHDETLQAVLVDDMHRLGWSEVLAEALRPTGQLVRALGEPAELQALARRYFEHDSKPSDGTQALAADLPLDSPDLVLFLDLRLFPPARLDEERKFVKELVQYARRIAQPDLPLKWPAIPAEELKLVDSWTESTSSDAHPGRTAALTLLPRLIALADPFLPIVLFSSTGSRDLLEPLKPYGSIITDFEKPRLWGADPTRVVELAREGMTRALDRARQLLQARRLCLALGKEQRVKDRKKPFCDVKHLELYIDESGNAGREEDEGIADDGVERIAFVITGLLVGYRSVDPEDVGSPGDLARKMESAGLRWWPESAGAPHLQKSRPPGPNRRYLTSSVTRADDAVAREFLGIVKKEHLPVLGVVMAYTQKTSPPKDPARGFVHEGRADNRFREMLAALLDLVIYELAPEIGVPSGTSLSVFVATRARVAGNFEAGRDMVARMNDLYGFHAPDGGTHVVVFGEDALHGLLYGLLASRPRRACPVEIGHARGVRLCYPHEAYSVRTKSWVEKDTRPQWRGTRHQHYIADILAGPCRRLGKDLKESKPELWKGYFERGLYDSFDPDTRALLSAGRGLDQGDLVESLVALRSPAVLRRNFREISGAALLLRRLREAVKRDLSGPDFLRLAAALEITRHGKAADAEAPNAEAQLPSAVREIGVARESARGAATSERNAR